MGKSEQPAATGIFPTPAERARRLADLQRVTEEFRKRNDQAERNLGVMFVRGRLIEAVAPAGGQPELRVDGRVKAVLDVSKGLEEAKAAARRAFVRMTNLELIRRRSPKELRSFVLFDGEVVRESLGLEQKIEGK